MGAYDCDNYNDLMARLGEKRAERINTEEQEERRVTNEEAIERINEHIAIHRCNEPQAIHIAEALQMGIGALKKQIPKKPGAKKLADKQLLGGHPVYVVPCGNCGYAINLLHSFCPWCGQAILWGEGE